MKGQIGCLQTSLETVLCLRHIYISLYLCTQTEGQTDTQRRVIIAVAVAHICNICDLRGVINYISASDVYFD